jgi:hypothetical protein
VWPADKHISLEEGFHFAACAKRIGKLASTEKKKFVISAGTDEEGMLSGSDVICQAPIFLVWKYLGCCEGLCGAALGMTVRNGFDCTVAWLCSTLTFGGQTVVEAMEHRHQWSDEESHQSLSKLGNVQPSDFDCRPPGYEKQESDSVVHPKPIPEVLDAVKKILEENPNDEVLNTGKSILLRPKRVQEVSALADQCCLSVSHELAFVVGTLEYIVARLSSPGVVESSWKNRHLHQDGGMMVGSFMNLHCGHNNPFSSAERKGLKALLLQATSSRPTSTVGNS